MGCCGGGGRHANYREVETRREEDPLATLKSRLAKGEITVDEYERMLDVLNMKRPSRHFTEHAMRAE